MKIRSHKVHNLLLYKINPLVRLLIVSDMLIIGALGMFAPLYALFVENNIVGADEFVIGISMAIFLVARSILQIPIATLLDKIHGERDDYFFVVFFSILAGALHFGLLFVTQVWHLYLIQFLLGVFTALTYPSFMAIFTRHIDKDMEGTEWGVYYTFVDLSTAALAAIGGYIASYFGFDALVITVSVICILGGVVLIPIKPYIYKRSHHVK